MNTYIQNQVHVFRRRAANTKYLAVMSSKILTTHAYSALILWTRFVKRVLSANSVTVYLYVKIYHKDRYIYNIINQLQPNSFLNWYLQKVG